MGVTRDANGVLRGGAVSAVGRSETAAGSGVQDTAIRKPRALRAGDRVAILAPASPFVREEFDRGVEEVQALGFEPVFDERVFARRGFVAGEPAERAAAFMEAWTDPSISGILCARGGYGSVQMLPLLDRDAIRAHAKVFVGYSDITTLLTWLTLETGLVTFHGPMLVGRFSQGIASYDRDTFLRAVSGTEPVGELPNDTLDVLRPGEASGMLIGGTLTQLMASLGTPYAFDPPPGHLLFIDEVGERPYRLDRLLMQWRLSGLMARAAGIIFNELPGCDEPGAGAGKASAVTARDVVRDLLRDFPGPVVMGLRSGHTSHAALTLPFGVRATLSVSAAPRLTIDEPAVV
jgi:muramoyltetrapeptide carboxypeptidase